MLLSKSWAKENTFTALYCIYWKKKMQKWVYTAHNCVVFKGLSFLILSFALRSLSCAHGFSNDFAASLQVLPRCVCPIPVLFLQTGQIHLEHFTVTADLPSPKTHVVTSLAWGCPSFTQAYSSLVTKSVNISCTFRFQIQFYYLVWPQSSV